jgi:hypothetical protein
MNIRKWECWEKFRASMKGRWYILQFHSNFLFLHVLFRLETKWQLPLRTGKAIREFPKPWLSIIILLKPSKCSTAGVLSSVFFHQTAIQSGSIFFHLSFLSFFHPQPLAGPTSAHILPRRLPPLP